MKYADKLKDPRWQKKRLEIMNRDGFACVRCHKDFETLHVHHLKYSGEPWEADNKDLMTLCESCHESEHTGERMEFEHQLLSALKLHSTSTIEQFTILAEMLRDPNKKQFSFNLLFWLLRSNKDFEKVYKSYEKHIPNL